MVLCGIQINRMRISTSGRRGTAPRSTSLDAAARTAFKGAATGTGSKGAAPECGYQDRNYWNRAYVLKIRSEHYREARR